MTSYTTHTSNGKITSSGSVPEAELKNQIIKEGEVLLSQASNWQTDYVDISTNTVKPKIELILNLNKTEFLADGMESIIIADLPIPCTITIDEDTYEVSDGEFEFTTDTVGVYEITVASIPYFTSTIKVTAV